MSDDDLEFLAARARMRQHHEWARRLRDIAQAEKAAGDRRTSARPKVRTRFSLAHLIRLFATRRWVRATRRGPMHQDT